MMFIFRCYWRYTYCYVFVNESKNNIIWIIVNFGASFIHSKQWAWGDPLIWNSIFITKSIIWPSGCASLSRYSEKNTSILCWNIWTPVMGFWCKYLLLSAMLNLNTSYFDNFIPNCTATVWIIWGQCKSAAGNVRNHVGIPKVWNIANTSYNWSCQ